MPFSGGDQEITGPVGDPSPPEGVGGWGVGRGGSGCVTDLDPAFVTRY